MTEQQNKELKQRAINVYRELRQLRDDFWHADIDGRCFDTARDALARLVADLATSETESK